jgi:hypothetical protein
MMTKKIYFLLAFLLTTIGGGNFALAADETFTLSTVTSGTSYDQTQNGVRLVIDKGSSGSSFHNGGNGYRLYPSGATITITAPEGYAVTELVLTSNKKGNDVDKMTGFTITGNSDWNPFSGKLDSYTWTNSSNTTNPITFTTKNSDNGDVYIASIKVTYSKVPYSGTMPYTWIFNYVGSQWPNTTASMLTSTTSYWETGSVGSQSGYVTKTALSNEALDDGSGTEISETTGLKFTAAAGNIGTTLQYELGLKGNASVTIPAKAGQKIAVYAYWPAETMTLLNATENTSNAGSFMPSAGINTYNFTATADDVTLQVNSSMVFIYSIAVTKTAITRFDFKGGSANTTTYDYDSNNPTFSPVLILEPSGAASNKSLFTVTNSTDTEVIAIANSGCSSINGNNINFGNSLQRKKPGTSTVTFSFAGNDAYEPKTFTATYTINKLTPTVTFSIGTDQTIPFTTGSYTDAATATMGRTVTYVSSDEHVATVNASGVVTYVNSGVTTITATAVGDDYYNEASASYKLTLNATSTPTLEWSSPHSERIPNATETVQYGNNFNCYCTNTGSATVQYRSSNTDIATVEIKDGQAGGTSYEYCQITPVNVGTATITAFVPSYQGEAERSISFTLTVTKGDIGDKLYFSPSSGTVQKDYTIGPRLKFPSMLAEDIKVLSAVSSDESTATVALEKNSTYLSYQNEKVDGVYPIVTGHKAGNATITVTFGSDKYNSATATYTVTVVESQSWNWSEPSKEYILYTEDFMKIPEITGNTTGNFQLSVGSYNAANSGYIYDIKKGAITYNNKDWHRGEGVPNYTIVTEGITNPGAAKIFWCKGGDNDGAALFVFAQSAGDVKLRATDTQTNTYQDLTIHILNKTNYSTYTDAEANGKNGATYGSGGNVHTTWSDNATTPFTWDFTTNFTVSDDTNCYWIDNGDDTYSLGYPTSFNYDWADTNNNGKTAGSGSNGNEESKRKAIHLKKMEGMTINVANNDGNWHNKENKVRILAAGTDAQGKPKGRLNINGGTFKLTVPNIPKTALASTYKVFVKAVSNTGGSEPLVSIVVDGTKNDNTPTTTPGIFSADVTTGEKVELWLNNVTIYWIALSTEENNTMKPSVNTNLTGAATTYSYGKALDLAKSEEVNGLTAYYARSFTNGDGVASTVILRQVTYGGGAQNSVPATTGLVLKSGNPSTNYMIADAENQESYTAPTALSENYLVAGDGSDVSLTTGSGNDIKTNFALSYAYKKFSDDGSTAMTGYLYDRDWSFYQIMPSANVPKGKAYLQVPGNLRVKTDGTIEPITPSGSRRAGDGSDDRPANKLMLDIVYEDEAHGFDATTAIGDVKTDTVTVDDDAWYTIQGVRVNTPARGGIYIHNGRKVVIK